MKITETFRLFSRNLYGRPRISGAIVKDSFAQCFLDASGTVGTEFLVRKKFLVFRQKPNSPDLVFLLGLPICTDPATVLSSQDKTRGYDYGQVGSQDMIRVYQRVKKNGAGDVFCSGVAHFHGVSTPSGMKWQCRLTLDPTRRFINPHETTVETLACVFSISNIKILQQFIGCDVVVEWKSS